MARRSTNSRDRWYSQRCPSSLCDRVTFLSPVTIHRPACIRLHRISGSGTPRSVIYAIDRDRDFVVHSIHHHHHHHQHYHYHHHHHYRCCNGSCAMTSAITWPRCVFAWKSESLNKLLAPVCERFDKRSERSSSSILGEWLLPGGINSIDHVRSGNDSSPRRRLSVEGSVASRELAAEWFSADRRMVWSEGAFGFGGLGPRPQCPWTIRHDYVAPRLLFVFPLPCSCPVLGLGGLLLFNLATLR